MKIQENQQLIQGPVFLVKDYTQVLLCYGGKVHSNRYWWYRVKVRITAIGIVLFNHTVLVFSVYMPTDVVENLVPLLVRTEYVVYK